MDQGLIVFFPYKAICVKGSIKPDLCICILEQIHSTNANEISIFKTTFNTKFSGFYLALREDFLVKYIIITHTLYLHDGENFWYYLICTVYTLRKLFHMYVVFTYTWREIQNCSNSVSASLQIWVSREAKSLTIRWQGW